MSENHDTEVSEKPAVSSAPDNGAAAKSDDARLNWAYLDECMERAWQAGLRMGNPPEDDWEPPSKEQLAKIAESSRRLRTLPRRKYDQTSLELIREMRGPPGPWPGKDEGEDGL